MTDNQENKRSMNIAVQKVCKKFKSIWSGIPAFVKAFADFETNIDDIETQRLIQEGKITGIATNKQKEEDEMIQLTIEIVGAVYAYAAENEDNELMEKVNYSPNGLSKERDTVLKDICQLIHNEAKNVVTNLADYDKTPADLNQLQKEINDFKDILTKPRTAIVTRSTATSQLVVLTKISDNILKTRMDKLMESSKTKERKFYMAYKSARIIVDLGVRHKQKPEEPQQPETP